MATPTPKTVRQQVAWSYANLARAHAALEDGITTYKKLHHIIRNKMYDGLLSGKITMRSLYDDERLKLTAAQACYYCGAKGNLAVDHLIPRIRGGADEGDNLIWACRACNSSKHSAWTSAVGRVSRISTCRHSSVPSARRTASRSSTQRSAQAAGSRSALHGQRAVQAFPFRSIQSRALRQGVA